MNLDFNKIETDRLSFRNLKLTDAESIFEYRSEPKIYLYQIQRPANIEDVTDFINSNIKLETDPSKNWFNIAIIFKKDNILIGDIGLFFFDRERIQLELGYTLSSLYQGKGYAEECLKSLIDYVFKSLNIHRIIASMDPRNIKSENLVKKLGLRLEAHHLKNMKIENEWVDTKIYAILKEEYLK